MTDIITGHIALDWLSHFTDTFHEAQERLTGLDRLAGDGDFGTNIASALRRAGDGLPERNAASFTSVFTAVSRGFLATGGTSGPLLGMWFRDIARSSSLDGAVANELAAGVAAGLATIQKLGGAKVGDNTLIDALSPASESLTDEAGRGGSVAVALNAAALAAQGGAESTGDLIASRGRATYVGELARGVHDPGAMMIALFFESGASVTGGPADRKSLAWFDSLIRT